MNTQIQIQLEQYTVPKASTLFASAEASNREYNKYLDANGSIWLLSTDPNCADRIYVEGGPDSDGFGGRIIKFKLTDGTHISLKGPWHSNSKSFKHATGVDVTDKHISWGLIAESGSSFSGEYANIYYIDTDPVISTSNRIEELAKEYAAALKHPVVYFSQGYGGSRGGTTNA